MISIANGTLATPRGVGVLQIMYVRIVCAMVMQNSWKCLLDLSRVVCVVIVFGMLSWLIRVFGLEICISGVPCYLLPRLRWNVSGRKIMLNLRFPVVRMATIRMCCVLDLSCTWWVLMLVLSLLAIRCRCPS